MPPDSAPRPADRNEAAERLRDALESVRGWREPRTIKSLLDAALAEERRPYIEALRWIADFSIGDVVENEDKAVFDYYRAIVRKARRILDEVAEDSR